MRWKLISEELPERLKGWTLNVEVVDVAALEDYLQLLVFHFDEGIALKFNIGAIILASAASARALALIFSLAAVHQHTIG